MSIASNIQEINKTIPSESKLIAVSKFQSTERILQAYQAGLRRFGENRAQEMCSKHEALPADIEWHFIGHLQRNKIKYIIPFTSLIQSVDSPALLTEINKAAAKIGRVVPCLLQIYIAREESKFGFTPEELRLFFREGSWKNLSNVRLQGLMGMATFTGNTEQVRQEFRLLKQLFDEIRSTYFSENESFRELSMGMTGDYKIAIQEGSTMLRIGTALFGSRKTEQ